MIDMTLGAVLAHKTEHAISDGPRSLNTIAREISRDWIKPNYAAVPYLSAMRDLYSMRDTFGHDSAVSVVSYFLANATTWKGETARRIKKELNLMIAQHRKAR